MQDRSTLDVMVDSAFSNNNKLWQVLGNIAAELHSFVFVFLLFGS